MELILSTKKSIGPSIKNAVIQTNDTTVAKLSIDFKITITPSPDTTSVVRTTPDQLKFALGGVKQQVVKVKNSGLSPFQLSQLGAIKDGMIVKIENDQIAPGAEGSITFIWSGGTLKQGIKHVATFSTAAPLVEVFSIPYVVDGTEPFPPEVEPKSVTVKPTAKPSEAKHVHKMADSLSTIPIQINPLIGPDGVSPAPQHVRDNQDTLHSPPIRIVPAPKSDGTGK